MLYVAAGFAFSGFLLRLVLTLLVPSAASLINSSELSRDFEDEPLSGKELERTIGLLKILKTEQRDGEDKTVRDKDPSSPAVLGPSADTDEKTAPFSLHYHDDGDIIDRTLYLLDFSRAEGARYYQVTFGDLKWRADTTYEDLLSSANNLSPSMTLFDFFPNDERQKTLLIHQVPKTASTSQRKILERNRRDCPEDDQKQPDTTCTRTPRLMQTCPQLGTFLYWTQSSASKSSTRQCFDYIQYDPRLANRQYLHAIPFRNFNEWAGSALNQIAKRQKNTGRLHAECEKLANMFSPSLCLAGVNELSFQRYSKTVLRFVLAETPPSDPIFLYNYADSSDYIMDGLLQQLGQEPMQLEHANIQHTKETCPEEILAEFHDCFDHKLEQGGL